jgi:hypothetical protein
MAVFGLLSFQVLVPRQFAQVCHSVNMEVGCQGKPRGCDCPSQLWKILFSNFQTLQTIEKVHKCSSIGQLYSIRNSGGLKTGLGQDA